MTSFATGIDVPISQMPAGMAFDSGVGTGSGGGFLNNLLGSVGQAVLGAANQQREPYSLSQGGGQPASYEDRYKNILGVLLTKAMGEFEDPEILIS